MCITRSESTPVGAFVNVDSKELACNTYVKNGVSPSIAANKILMRSQPSPESKNASRYAGAAGSVAVLLSKYGTRGVSFYQGAFPLAKLGEHSLDS
jgi:hypothetical protein